MFCTSINYKFAGTDIRRKFTFSPEMCRQFMSELIKSGNVSQCVILCTCNRTEVYFCGNEKAPDHVQFLLAEYGNTKTEELSPCVMLYQGDKAVYHLFKVASGIDSMVIGEDEILGQTKNAYITAKESGFVSGELNIIFQSAIACAKKIKTETALSKTSVSIASLAANEAVKSGSNINVLLIGATGKTGMTVLKNLMSHKSVNITATIRQHNSGLKIVSDSNVNTVSYSQRYRYINDADFIISATSSPHYTITLCELQKSITQHKNRLFIDLAVPPDIDSSVLRIEGAKLLGIDYFEKLAETNNALKMDSVEAAKQIISEETDTLKKELCFHDFMPCMKSVKEKISSKSLEEIIYKFKSQMKADAFSEFLNIIKEIT